MTAPATLPEEGRPSETALAAAGSRQAAQRVEIEGKLNALFRALDRTPRRQAGDPDDEGAAGRRRALLGETAISSSWRLDKAVAEIAERQASLDRQAATAEAHPPTARPAPEPHAGPAGGDLRLAYPAPVAAAPSAFASLRGDIAKLATTLEAVQLDVSRWPAAARGDARAAAEPEAPLTALNTSVEKLAARLDVLGQSDAQAATIQKLSERIEEVHADLGRRIAEARPAVDAADIERLVDDVVARRPALAGTAPDLASLEAAVKDLAGKLVAAERSEDDGRLLVEMQAQVGRLAERIDRTDAGLSAIVAMERSLGGIIAQVGEMKEMTVAAAETAGRAAEDAVRAMLPRLAAEGAGAGGLGVAEVTRGLAEMRAERDQADERLHAILTALNGSLEQVAIRLETLEGADPAEAAHLSQPATPAVAPAAPSPAAPPITWTASARSESFEPGEPLDLDLPLEPGVQFPAAGVAPQPAAVPDPSSFIAAARRAAQNAAQESRTRPEPDAAARRKDAVAPAEAGDRSLIGRLTRRRPLLLALAGLLVLAGAAQIARMTLVDPAGSGNTADVTGSIAPVPTVAAAGGRDAARPAGEASATASTPTETAAGADRDAPLAGAPALAAADPAPAADDKAQLPTMAMGPLASVAALKAADASARLSSSQGIPVGLQQVADGGRADAQFEVGLRYAEGRRVPRDMKVAAGWFEKAAAQGLPPAAYRLGSLYEKGLGVARDPAQSIAWYRKAADAGNVRAMHNLAVMLAEGANDKADYPQAASWFTKAAEAGVRDSQYNLAILLARGLGVGQDLVRSYTWFAIAAAQGDIDAGKKRDEVAGKLDAAALATAKAAAEAFKPQPTVAAANDVKPPPGGWDATLPHAAAASGGAPVSRL